MKKEFDAFVSSTVHDWERVAREELQGANPWEKLTQQGEGFTIRPYYDSSSTKQSFHLPTSSNEFLGPRAWYNCPRVRVSDSRIGNETALRHLSQGADGIFFELADTVSFDILLENIQWEFCSLNFLANKLPEKVIGDLKEFMARKEISREKAHGSFFGFPSQATSQNQLFRFGGVDR